MTETRPLRDVFADLAGSDGPSATSPADVLAANGHPDLPNGLVAEAVGSYADTAPVEIAEHLSPYVMAHSPVPLTDAPEVDSADWFDAVMTAPTETYAADPADLDAADLDAAHGTSMADPGFETDHTLDPDHAFDTGHPGHDLGPGQPAETGHEFGRGFTLDADAGQVHFGDAGYGQVPPEDTHIPTGYEHGGGDDGNLHPINPYGHDGALHEGVLHDPADLDAPDTDDDPDDGADQG
jgi:hypothetical protein